MTDRATSERQIELRESYERESVIREREKKRERERERERER